MAWLPPLAMPTILWPDSAVMQRGWGWGSNLIWMLAAGGGRARQQSALGASGGGGSGGARAAILAKKACFWPRPGLVTVHRPLTVLGVVHVVVAVAQLPILGVSRRPHAALAGGKHTSGGPHS
jgi:hypothetical protein